MQLGWDATIAIQEHDLQYRITVQSADGTECVYRTLEVFSKADSVRRMYKAGIFAQQIVHDYTRAPNTFR